MIRLAAALVLLAGCKETLEPDVVAPASDPSFAWGALLADVVTDDGYVDYDQLELRRGTLDSYVAWLGNGRLPHDSLARNAYWINAYNALVLWTVLEEGRPPSVLDVAPTRFFPGPRGVGFFVQRQFRFRPEKLSLSEIEDEKLRVQRQDIRLHAALNCASRSCPPLRNELYTQRRLEWQLQDQMVHWVNDPERGVRVVDGQAEFSALFDWYAKDFRDWTAHDDLCTTAARFARGTMAVELRALSEQGCPHTFREYDWRLNDAP